MASSRQHFPKTAETVVSAAADLARNDADAAELLTEMYLDTLYRVRLARRAAAPAHTARSAELLALAGW